jgi:hypothetical protein
LLHYPQAAADGGQPGDNEDDENYKERCEHGYTPFLPLRAAKAAAFASQPNDNQAGPRPAAGRGLVQRCTAGQSSGQAGIT